MKKLVSTIACFIACTAFNQPIIAGDFPLELNQRDATIPKGVLEVQPGFTISDEFSRLDMILEARYGITDDLQIKLLNIGAQLASEFGLNKGAGIEAQHLVFETKDFHLAPTLGFYLNLGDLAAEKAQQNLNVGLDSRFNLLDNRISLHFGHDLFTYHTFNENWALNLHLSIAYQLQPNVNIAIATNLFNIIGQQGEDLATLTYGDEHSPLALSINYAINQTMDIGASISFANLQHAGESMDVGVTFTWRRF